MASEMWNYVPRENHCTEGWLSSLSSCLVIHSKIPLVIKLTRPTGWGRLNLLRYSETSCPPLAWDLHQENRGLPLWQKHNEEITKDVEERGHYK